jgi:hypothetical protein
MRRATTHEALQTCVATFPLMFLGYGLFCWLDADHFSVRNGLLLGFALAIAVGLAARLLPIALVVDE